MLAVTFALVDSKGLLWPANALGRCLSMLLPRPPVLDSLVRQSGGIVKTLCHVWRQLTRLRLHRRPREPRHIVEPLTRPHRVLRLLECLTAHGRSQCIIGDEALKAADHVRLRHPWLVAEHPGWARIVMLTQL